MSIEHFIVDAALLSELGERLIGRPHIAIAELIKNAYDADASICEVTIADDRIEVADNGHGMDLDTFKSFYLRLGTQNKRERETSPELGRRLTGSKGVGRVAAQFLGIRLVVETAAKGLRKPAVRATIEWSKIKSGDDLAKFPVEVEEVDRLEIQRFPDRATHGMRVLIEKLRTELSTEDIEGLGREVWSLRSPFERSRIRGKMRDARDFEIRLDTGVDDAEERFDAVLDALTKHVWRAKITGRVERGRQTGMGLIAIEFTGGYPTGAPERSYRDEISIPGLKWADGGGIAEIVSKKTLLDDVSFTVFTYKLENKQRANVPLEELKDYLGRFGSVGLYDTGFRLPYYGIDNDWLRNGADQAKRLSISSLLPSKWKVDDRYMLDLPEPRRLFGYVEVSTNREAAAARAKSARPGEWLEIQSGRDRLIDNKAHRQLQAFIRYSLDLYANRYRARLIRSRESARGTEPAQRKYSRLREVLHENRDVIPSAVHGALEAEAKDAERAAAASDDLADARIVALAPLAAAGMTALGMTHELAREARLIDRARRRLVALAREHGLPELKDTADELGRSLTRLRALQSLFSPLLSRDDREGDDRLRVEPIAAQVANAMGPLTPGMSISIDVDDELRFPAAPLAAWNAVLQNVIANSWNASLGTRHASVLIEGWSDDGSEGITVSDKGSGVDLQGTERLFDAFERALEIAPEHVGVAIGGTGLGLAIVRMLCENYGVTASFVEPRSDYATTLNLEWEA